MTKLEQSRAMKCFGGMVECIELDPDPNTQDKLTEEYNCVNCDYYEYCKILTDTLN